MADGGNLLGISWSDSVWTVVDRNNVMDYFADRSNPFYDRTCNNEVVKMQRLTPEQLNNMTGLEYILLHVQEPFLYVVRKQHRHSPTQGLIVNECEGDTTIGDKISIALPLLENQFVVAEGCYLYGGKVEEMLNSVHNLQCAFDEAQAFSRYHPSKGYSWEFKDQEEIDKNKEKKKKIKEEPSSLFQRQRVDLLLAELSKKYPPVIPQPPEKPEEHPKVDPKQEIKVEKPDPSAVKPPPEKKQKLR